MTLAHVHILLNHFPTIGMIVAMGLYILSLIWKSEDVKVASLAVLFGLDVVAIATYMSGYAGLQELEGIPGISKAAVLAHEDAATLAFAVMQLTGIVAWLGLWQHRRIKRIAKGIQGTVLVLGLLTLVLMSNAANVGGEIRHPEILTKADLASRNGAGPTRGLIHADALGAFVVGEPWMWPTCETLHFVGLSLLLGVVLAVASPYAWRDERRLLHDVASLASVGNSRLRD